MTGESLPSRRTILSAAVAGGGLLLAGCASHRATKEKTTPAKSTSAETDTEVSPPEDLMREHGVLLRVMLVYDELVRQLTNAGEIPPEVPAEAARITRSFIEDYHEKLEEDHVFPRFEKAGRLVELVRVLRLQHQAGRRVTDEILHSATPAALKNPEARARLVASIRRFNRMYAPHAAREDTVLFPAFHGLVSASEYDALGEEFEKQENQLFGAEGFEKTVARVAGLENTLGIYELSQFTPEA